MLRPTDKEVEDFYRHDYRNSAADGEYPNRSNFRTHIFRSPRQLALVYDRLTQYEAGLDIGCALGWTVAVMQYAGIDAYGTEWHEVDREWALDNLGLNIYQELEDLPRRNFGLVTMSHVLEHIANPIEYLRMLQDENYLAPGGDIIFEVPGQGSPSGWSAYHLVVFSQDSLRFVCEEAGLELINGTENRKHKDGPPQLIWLHARRPSTPGNDS